MVFKGLVAALAALTLSLPVALAADPPRIAPGQRVELRVLLLSADGSEPGYAAWRAALDREGIPYDAIVAAQAAALTDATLADYEAGHARYQAVITASGDLGQQVTNPGQTVSRLSVLSDAEWAALDKFERTFGIRRLSDDTAATPAHGLVAGGGAWQDGQVGRLTADGRAAFPYLKGPVAIADDAPGPQNDAFGTAATPVDPAKWRTLLASPSGAAFLGIYTPGDGREEMVMTVASNQYQNHNQLLRHGMLNWVTRGVFLGFQRNYLELHVDDLFVGDDAWDEATNTTNYDPAAASRMTPGDVDRAIAWSRSRGLRIDMAYNAGGTAPGDPLTAKFADPAVRNAFGYINHTLDHPNLDCSTAEFITSQVRQNAARADQLGLPDDPSELVTGEHSGLANARPGNPGTIDPPSIDVAEAVAGGSLPAGTYDYALTARSPAGETVPSVVTNVAAATGSVAVGFDAVCHAIGFDLYRRPTGTTAWARVATLPRAADAATDDRTQPLTLTITDTGAAGTPGEPPESNGAALAPYGQNPALASALAQAGVRTIASDASKGYPSVPTAITSPLLPAGASFVQGTLRAVPRYPSNVYYNVSRQGQQLDEYNWIYVAPANGGGCVPIAGVTTCRTTPATWAEYVALETGVMFRHVMGNDPRPHYFHQSNLADYNPALPETDPAQGGILYPVIGALVDRYEAGFDRARSPLVQLTQSQAADELARADAWAAARDSVSAWVQDGRVYVRNDGASAVQVPVTGTTAGELYGGQRSGWITVAPKATTELAPADPAATAAPIISGTPQVGASLRATSGAWGGTAPIALTRQWQRCAARCVNIAGATDDEYRLVAADEGQRIQVAVTAGNWVSSVSQAVSAKTSTVAGPQRSGDTPRRDGSSSPAGGRRGPLRLTRLRMSPRRFTVAHRRLPKGTRLDGTRVSWRLNRAATVRLTFQKRTRSGYKRIGVIERKAKPGAAVVRFRGRFGRKLLKPQRYRVTVVARGGGDRTAARRLTFRVVKR